MSIDRVIVLLVVASFVVTSISSLIVRGGPITEEQAIEISKTSDYVRQGLAEAKYGSYVDAQYVESWDVWYVEWSIPENPPLEESFDILVHVDAETGDILFAAWGHTP